MIDLLVVGGGPAGLGTAIQAARAGLDVLVAEPRDTPIDKACGEGLMPAAVGALDDIGVHVTGHPLRGIRYLDERHRAEAMFRAGSGLGVRRTDLHTALAERAARLGIPVRPVRVTEVRQDTAGVTAAGVTARYLAAADGLHSPIRRHLELGRTDPRPARYGLRRHFAVAPWSSFVEVHWTAGAEAYVTPLGERLVGVAILGTGRGTFDERLRAFPGLADRLGAAPGMPPRGAGPLRQRVCRRVAGRVLLVGDAAGYTDALTGEGIAIALAAAGQLVRCVRADRVADYERAWRRATRRYRMLTEALVWTRGRRALAGLIVPAAARFPPVFSGAVDVLAGGHG